MKAIQQFFDMVLRYFSVFFLIVISVFLLQIAAVANSTEYRLGLTKNANMTGKLLGKLLRVVK